MESEARRKIFRMAINCPKKNLIQREISHQLICSCYSADFRWKKVKKLELLIRRMAIKNRLVVGKQLFFAYIRNLESFGYFVRKKIYENWCTRTGQTVSHKIIIKTRIFEHQK